MAIKNASDLLVYKKTTPAQPQITRIKIKSSTPLKDFTPPSQTIFINNMTDADGDITDGESDTININSGAHIADSIYWELDNKGYDVTNVASSGGFHFIDATNGANGPVPTLEIVDGTAEFKAGAVEIVVLQSGQSLVYQPIAYSTSASLGVSKDLRDITTKDSQGWQENAKGLGSFELSTDALWDVNNAVGVEAATEDLIVGDSVDVKFSDRVRNLVATEEVYGADWFKSTSIDIVKHLQDPFGQFTAASFDINAASNYAFTYYEVPIQLVEGKKITWSFYLKKSGTTGTSATFKFYTLPGAGTSNSIPYSSFSKLSGAGTMSAVDPNTVKITGLTTGWTRVSLSINEVSGTDLRALRAFLYPGADYANQTTADKVITASWQVETSTSATDYQNPTEVDCYQGKAFVNSVSVDAGVEDNATYSASFTGTSEIFINGLGHELVGDNYFDGTETTVGLDKFLVPNWKVFNSSTNATSSFPGYAKLKWTSNADTYLISHTGSVNINPMVVGKKYELTYTVSTYVSGDLKLTSTSGDSTIPVAEGTHTLRFTADSTELLIRKAAATSGEIHITYLSLKEVFS